MDSSFDCWQPTPKLDWISWAQSPGFNYGSFSLDLQQPVVDWQLNPHHCTAALSRRAAQGRRMTARQVRLTANGLRRRIKQPKTAWPCWHIEHYRDYRQSRHAALERSRRAMLCGAFSHSPGLQSPDKSFIWREGGGCSNVAILYTVCVRQYSVYKIETPWDAVTWCRRSTVLWSLISWSHSVGWW